MTASDYTVQTQELKLKVSEFGQILLVSEQAKLFVELLLVLKQAKLFVETFLVLK